jgi:hypothetical protein
MSSSHSPRKRRSTRRSKSASRASHNKRASRERSASRERRTVKQAMEAFGTLRRSPNYETLDEKKQKSERSGKLYDYAVAYTRAAR